MAPRDDDAAQDAGKPIHISLLKISVVVLLACILPLFALMAVRGPVDGEGDTGDGYWGTKTANTNWCEADYVVTKYIAEFGNSISSLCITVSGLYGIYMHRKSTEPRYTAAFAGFTMVGVGSFAFHATLWRSMQLLDELPMVWVNSVFIYCIIAMEDELSRAPRTRELFALTSGTVMASVAIALFDTKDQTIFLVCYGGGAIYLFVRSKMLDLKYNSRGTVVLLETSMAAYAGGFACWLIDRNFCTTVRSLYLHCFWHFGADIGTFSGVLFWIWVRYEFLGKKPKVRGQSLVTRWIEIPEKVV